MAFPLPTVHPSTEGGGGAEPLDEPDAVPESLVILPELLPLPLAEPEPGLLLFVPEPVPLGLPEFAPPVPEPFDEPLPDPLPDVPLALLLPLVLFPPEPGVEEHAQTTPTHPKNTARVQVMKFSTCCARARL